ncbi:MAG: hypothetical protein J4N86_06855 [Chloroflexi bacterium]|nr:hypothetical protein [Chloroflexota bacterium]
MTSILRSGAAMVLGVVIFVGFLFFLILNNFSDKLLSADFYNDTIAAEDTYNRIYDEVLVDEELLDKTEEFLGDIQVVNHQDIVDLMREIMPPAYIQAQVEAAIERTIAYVNEDVDELDVYVELAEPLRNVKTVMFAYIDGRIDELLVEDPKILAGLTGCLPNELQELSDRYEEKFNQLAEGTVPKEIPSLEEIPELCRAPLFDILFPSLVSESSLSDETKQNLRDKQGALRKPFVAGETLEMLKVAARPLAEPLMDDAIGRVREDLSEGDRFDLIRQLAAWDPDTTEAQLRADLDEGREWVSRARSFGELTTLVMVIGGAIVMGLVFLPTLTGMLRWPGIALLITGAFFFVAGKIAESEVPKRLADVIETGADQVSGVPPSVTDLGGDILISFGSQLTDGFTGPSLTLLIIGAILFGASFFTIIIKRFIPIVK